MAMTVTHIPTGPKPQPGSVGWWVRRLSRRLDERRIAMTKANDYYEGRQPLAFASQRFIDAFGDRFPEFSSNFMALVVDSHRDRLQVQGIRYGDEREGDPGELCRTRPNERLQVARDGRGRLHPARRDRVGKGLGVVEP